MPRSIGTIAEGGENLRAEIGRESNHAAIDKSDLATARVPAAERHPPGARHVIGRAAADPHPGPANAGGELKLRSVIGGADVGKRADVILPHVSLADEQRRRQAVLHVLEPDAVHGTI